jgi:hypothetical protein
MAEALPVAVAAPAPPSPLLSAQLYREMAASALGGAPRAPAAALASLTLKSFRHAHAASRAAPPHVALRARGAAALPQRAAAALRCGASRR